jgi:hypothetical protein
VIVPEYTPGDWYAVVAGGVVLLLAPSTPPEVVRDVWAAAPERGGGLGAQLDALVRHGIGGLHPFAAVDLATGAVHTALRGDVEVEVVRGTRAEVLSAPQVVSWSERSVGSADEVTVRASGASRGPALPIVSGVVRASRVRVRLTGAAELSDASASGPVVLAAAPTPVAVAPAAEAAPVTNEAAPVEAEPVDAVETAQAWQVEAEPVAVTETVEPEPAEPQPADPVAVEPEAEETAPEDDAPEETAPEVPAEVAATPSAPVDAAPAPAPEPEALAPAPAPGPFVPPAPPAPVLPGPASADDHDGLTILSGELASIRQHLPSWAVSQTGDWPSGAVLPTPSPAPGPFGAPLGTGAIPVGAGSGTAPTAQATVPRLAMSTGALVPVDGVVLIGRAPQATRAPDGAQPRLITVPSPEQDISRTHAEVRLELGRVLVTDLYSTNGITVASGGLPPRRITAGEPVAVGDGDVVDLGDGVTFTVEPGA